MVVEFDLQDPKYGIYSPFNPLEEFGGEIAEGSEAPARQVKLGDFVYNFQIDFEDSPL